MTVAQLFVPVFPEQKACVLCYLGLPGEETKIFVLRAGRFRQFSSFPRGTSRVPGLWQTCGGG